MRGSAGAAGYDLASAENAVIPSNARLLIRTGLRLVIPERHYGRIAPRSGLALKGIDVAGGVIDGDFKGEMRVILVNTTADAFEVRTGDRIAQLILEQCSTPEIVEISDVGESERGEAGFGSTGV